MNEFGDFLDEMRARAKKAIEEHQQEHAAHLEMGEALLRSFFEGLSDTQLEDLRRLFDSLAALGSDAYFGVGRVSGMLLVESWRRKPEELDVPTS